MGARPREKIFRRGNCGFRNLWPAFCFRGAGGSPALDGFAPRMSFWQGSGRQSATVCPSPPRLADSFFDENGLFSRVLPPAATETATPPPCSGQRRHARHAVRGAKLHWTCRRAACTTKTCNCEGIAPAARLEEHTHPF